MAGNLAKRRGLKVTHAGVMAAARSPPEHSLEEFGQKPESLGEGQAEAHGVAAAPDTVISHDPATDVDDALLKATGETSSHLAVMASHVPGLAKDVRLANGARMRRPFRDLDPCRA